MSFYSPELPKCGRMDQCQSPASYLEVSLLYRHGTAAAGREAGAACCCMLTRCGPWSWASNYDQTPGQKQLKKEMVSFCLQVRKSHPIMVGRSVEGAPRPCCTCSEESRQIHVGTQHSFSFLLSLGSPNHVVVPLTVWSGSFHFN